MLVGNARAKATPGEVIEISGRKGGGYPRKDRPCPHPGSCSYFWVATKLVIRAAVISMPGDSKSDVRKNEERMPVDMVALPIVCSSTVSGALILLLTCVSPASAIVCEGMV